MQVGTEHFGKDNRINEILTIIPEHRTVRFARVERGGTGRFDLLVVKYDMEEVVVRPSLSKWQAEEAAKVINEAFVSWLPNVL